MLQRICILTLLSLPAAFAAPAAASISVNVDVPSAMRTAPFDVNRTLLVPPGFRISVVARIPAVRFMAVAPNGDILVSQPSAGRVMLVRPRQAAGPQMFEFASGMREPHDIVFHTIGGTTYIYITESDQINRFVYVPGDTSAHDRQIIVTGLPAAGHSLKNIALDRNHKLFVSIASTCNVCLSDTISDPLQGAIYQYNADGSGRRLFARGLRNAEGLALLPGTDQLWAVVNNRDEIIYPRQDETGNYGKLIRSYTDDHPPEPFTLVSDGGNYGWPFCNPTQDSPSGYDNMLFEPDYEMNRDGAVNCQAMDRITRGIQAHSAPLGLSFLHDSAFPGAYRFGAVAGLHGSWNRSRPTGYKVIWFPWISSAQRPAAPLDLVSGWLNESTTEVWGRPVDAVSDNTGGLLISDDGSGTIYRLYAEPAGACTFTLSRTDAQFPASGGNGTATLSPSSQSCAWTSSSSSSWVQIFPLNGSGAKELTYNVYPNFSTQPRTAFVEVADRPLAVQQAGSTGTQDERFVRRMYFSFFGRIPAMEEVAFHVSTLASGLSRAQLVWNFLNSLEFNQAGRFVAGLYVGLLDRDAEYDGWLFQRNALATGAADPMILIANFLGSTEYQLRFGSPDDSSFVTLLYRKVLLREPDPGEVAFQSGALRAGMSRTQLAATFLNSAEFRAGTGPRLVAFLLHATVLLRDPLSAEQLEAMDRLRAGTDVRVLIGEMLAGREFGISLQ
jgi:glucose/arabinose dehydrogenase